jgi:hypothetical protein
MAKMKDAYTRNQKGDALPLPPGITNQNGFGDDVDGEEEDPDDSVNEVSESQKRKRGNSRSPDRKSKVKSK